MLDEIVDILNQYPDYDVRLTGHTDNVGNDAYNLILSQNRVDAVMQYLIDKGISASKLEAIGYGKTRPVATNNTAMGRALNRRVEIELYLK
jgi:outer membrane protein OmpA-like peptidoglycan-associated protein